MIEGIDISGFKDINFYNMYNDEIQMLPNLKKVNIFIGENNCGKSRLMRSFAKEEFQCFSINDQKEKISNIDSYLDKIRKRNYIFRKM